MLQRKQAIAVAMAVLMAGTAPLLAQQIQTPSATFCAGQDQIFARNFDLFGVITIAAASLAIPCALMFVRARWWWMTRWFRRGAVPVAAVVLMMLLMLVGLPWFAIRGVVSPKIGLAAYASVDAQYLACTDESFRSAGVVFGQFGPARGALVHNPGLLILTIAVTAAVGFAAFVGFFMLTRSTKGLARR
jgi:hypothetical protein